MVTSKQPCEHGVPLNSELACTQCRAIYDPMNHRELIARCKELAAEVQRLQRALRFWLPRVPVEESARAERVASDVFLLCGLSDLPSDDTAESRGWITLSAPETTANVARLHPPTAKLSRLSDIYDELIREMRRQGFETLQGVYDGVRIRIDPWPDSQEKTSGNPSLFKCLYCRTQFPNIVALNKHEALCERRAPDVTCDLCQGLRVVNAVEPNQPPVPCPKCGAGPRT